MRNAFADELTQLAARDSRIVLLSGKKARAGLAGFGGRLLAHELGHVLTRSHVHSTTSSNLMYGVRNPRMVNAGMLTPQQVRKARQTAQSI